MWKNHFKIAFRLIIRQRSHVLTSIIGLSIGITISLLLLLYVSGELSYDAFHKNANDIYRINVISHNPEADFYRTKAPAPLAELLKFELPEVAATTKITRPRTFNNLVKANGKEFYEPIAYMSDEGFFEVFSFKMLHGDPGTALDKPGNVILTESMAKKYFGKTSVVGETINYENLAALSISGVLKDIPQNSSLKFDFIISDSTPGLLYDNWMIDWGNSNASIYVRLRAGSDAKLTEAKFPDIVDQYVSDLDEDERYVMSLQSLPNVYLNPHVAPEQIWAASNKKYVYFLPIVGFFILIIAGFNYVNLSMARMTDRLKEVGVRKIMGSYRNELIVQFLIESFTIVLVAMLLALILVFLLLPLFNRLADRTFQLIDMMNLLFLGSVVIITFVLGTISGIYPALVLSKIKPVLALNQGFTSIGSGKAFFRNSLLTVQFAAAMIMIVTTIVVHQQLRFIQQKSLGFDQEQVIYFSETDKSFWAHAKSFKNELIKNPNIAVVAFSSGIPGAVGFSGTASLDNGNDQMELMHIMVDHDFMSLYDFEIVEGRSFQSGIRTDETAAFLLNETAVKSIGWDNPLNNSLNLWGREGNVIGIVKDFHFESMKKPIGPLAFHFGPKRYRLVSIKIGGDNFQETINFIEHQWQLQMPDRPFQYQFIESQFEEYYQEERRYSYIADIATAWGLLLAMTGLFNLTAFSMNQRAKEIGIRRVLGASYLNVLRLFLNKMFWICIIALLLSIPLAYLGIREWLNGFAYHVNISAHNFGLTAGLLALIVVLTIGLQVRRFIFGNPVATLRYE